MKELNNFRNFLNEDQMKNLAKLLRDEADQPDNKVGKSIFLKYAAQAEKTDVKDIKSLLGKLEDELIGKHPDRFSGEDDIVGSFLSVSKNYTVQENEIHEGTWSLGSPEQINDIINGLQAIIKMADNAENKKNAAGRGFVDGLKNQLKDEGWNSRIYRIVGDDSFHDAYDNAKSAAELNDFDRVKNGLGDAIARATELRDTILKNRGLEEDEDTGEAVDADYDLQENDAVLDEVSESMGIFREIDMMVGSIKDQMDPDDAFDSLVSEFEAISGGTKLLHRALKNISLDNNL